MNYILLCYWITRDNTNLESKANGNLYPMHVMEFRYPSITPFLNEFLGPLKSCLQLFRMAVRISRIFRIVSVPGPPSALHCSSVLYQSVGVTFDFSHLMSLTGREDYEL